MKPLLLVLIFVAIVFSQNDSLYLRLPEQILTTTASQYSIYYENLILTQAPANYNFEVHCSAGKDEGSKYNLDSLNSGIYSLRIDVKDSTGSVIDSAESDLVVIENNLSFEDTLKILFIGDSKTYSAVAQKYCQDLLLQSGNRPIKFLGTHYNAEFPNYGVDNDLFHEGWIGFGWRRFAGYLESPFVFVSGNYWEVYPDCRRYFRESLSGEKPDLVIFFLGIVDIFPCVTTNITEIDARINEVFNAHNMDKLIDSMEVALPQAKIGISLIPPANPRKIAWQTQWGDSLRGWYYRNAQHRLVQRYIDHFKLLNKPNYSMVPVYLNFDIFSGYSEYECLHPNSIGYKQEAHSIYAWIKYQISQCMTEPKNLQIVNTGSSSILTWDASSGAYKYSIYRSTDPYSGFEKIDETALTGYTDSAVSGSVKYFYYVTSDNMLK